MGTVLLPRIRPLVGPFDPRPSHHRTTPGWKHSDIRRTSREGNQKVLKEYKSLPIDKLPPFTGGLVGYFSYDYIKYQESHLLLDYTEDEAFKDLDLMFFDQVICFDHYRQVLTLIVTYRASEVLRDTQKLRDGCLQCSRSCKARLLLHTSQVY